MSRQSISIFLLILQFIVSSCVRPVISPTTDSHPLLNWQKEVLAPGLEVMKVASQQLFDSRQYFTVLRVNPVKRKFHLLAMDTFTRTSVAAQKNNALAAVNGGFYNMKRGGSVTFLKENGRVVTPVNATGNDEIVAAAITVDWEGKVRIERARDSAYYTDNALIKDVLLTGPLLLEQGKAVKLKTSKFNDNRHPRTCVCTDQTGMVYLLTADGRNAQAQGVNLHELREVMQSLGCYQAINLDGGGSTTLWTKRHGVMNHPSDNKQFDIRGERSVANIWWIN